MIKESGLVAAGPMGLHGRPIDLLAIPINGTDAEVVRISAERITVQHEERRD